MHMLIQWEILVLNYCNIQGGKTSTAEPTSSDFIIIWTAQSKCTACFMSPNQISMLISTAQLLKWWDQQILIYDTHGVQISKQLV